MNRRPPIIRNRIPFKPSSSIEPVSSPYESSSSPSSSLTGESMIPASSPSSVQRLSTSTIPFRSSSSSSSSSTKKMRRRTPKQRTAGCKGKKIVECNTTTGCKFTTGNKRNFCRKTKNASKLTLSDEDMELLIRTISNAYAGDPKLEYVIGRIRKTRCKFNASYKSSFTGKIMTGPDKVYDQALDKVQSFFKYGEDKIF